MRLVRKTNLLVEPPSSATGDIAFNLLVFFLVCASTQPSSGRRQEIPRGQEQKQQVQSQNIEVRLTRTTIIVSPPQEAVAEADFPGRIRELLSAKTKPEDRVVVVKSEKDTPYRVWIKVAAWIEQAGGTITLQLEEETTEVVN